jgi:hypothetical protein
MSKGPVLYIRVVFFLFFLGQAWEVSPYKTLV